MINKKFTKYLLCYFTGNEPEKERIHFAVSKNGFSFTAVNNGKPVIEQKLGKKCCRDPFIFRDEDNIFHIIATDMRCRDGWNSNNSLVIWDSDDLITWENERIIDFSKFKGLKNTDRAWAPEVLFDKSKNEYMLYWSHHRSDNNDNTVIWYAYTKDFINFTSEPSVLFRPKSNMDGIDADIIEAGGTYYLYYKDELKKTICYAVSDKLSGPYKEPDCNSVADTDSSVEGSCIYKIIDSDQYIMIIDQYADGRYFMQSTSDLINFKKINNNNFALNHLKPRHASVLHITDEEYNSLLQAFK